MKIIESKYLYIRCGIIFLLVPYSDIIIIPRKQFCIKRISFKMYEELNYVNRHKFSTESVKDGEFMELKRQCFF